MSGFIDLLKSTVNGRELNVRDQVASAIQTCEARDYEPKTAIWAGLTVLGEVAINLAVIADALTKEDQK